MLIFVLQPSDRMLQEYQVPPPQPPKQRNT